MTMKLSVPPARVVFTSEDIRQIRALIEGSLLSGALTLGPIARQFEQEMTRACQTRHAVAVSSGTSALEIALRALRVQGREVIVPANTFYATAGAVVHAGATLKLADIERQSFALDPEDVARRLTPNTAAVVLVHIAGVVSPRTPELVQLCAAKGVPVIEDAAHAAGASLHGKPAGSFGIAGTFSFYPTKIVTSGEGGMLVTNDDRIREEALLHRDQGKAGFTQNVHTRLGHNWRMSEPHAAIGLTHFRHLERFVEERHAIARLYDAALAELPSVTPVAMPRGCRSNYYKYLAMLPAHVDRAALKQRLRSELGVSLSGEVYELPLHAQPVFEGVAARGSLPVAEELCARHVCLPIFQGMSEADVSCVVSALHRVIGSL